MYCEQMGGEDPYYNYGFIMAPSQTLGLNNTLNLPKVNGGRPYGFWVNKFGHWINIPYEGHTTAAVDIVQKYNAAQPDPTKKFDIDKIAPNFYTALWKNGYIRMVDDNGVYLWEHPSRGFSPSPAQQKFFKELNMEYHTPVKRDPYTQED